MLNTVNMSIKYNLESTQIVHRTKPEIKGKKEERIKKEAITICSRQDGPHKTLHFVTFIIKLIHELALACVFLLL